MITGTDHRVYIDGEILLPNDSLKIVNHSPSGFAWGYGGSGPSQLALALLLVFADRDFAVREYQNFKHDVIAMLPQEDFELHEDVIHKWIKDRKML